MSNPAKATKLEVGGTRNQLQRDILSGDEDDISDTKQVSSCNFAKWQGLIAYPVPSVRESGWVDLGSSSRDEHRKWKGLATYPVPSAGDNGWVDLTNWDKQSPLFHGFFETIPVEPTHHLPTSKTAQGCFVGLNNINVDINKTTIAALHSGTASPASLDHPLHLHILSCDTKANKAHTKKTALVLDCRCGLTGKADVHYTVDTYGETVQCSSCRMVSHIACQRYGRRREKKNEGILTLAREAHVKPLTDRFRVGCGALAKHGDYFYPVRLVQKIGERWTVCWWRGNEYSNAPPPVFSVPEADLTDALWRNMSARRKIRLGKWIHTCDVASIEDILADPTSVPYTEDVNNALLPHKDLLVKLSMYEFESIKDNDVPAKRWVEGMKLNLRLATVPHVGQLSVVQWAQVANWFDTNITCSDLKRRLDWLGRLPIAHAHTIYIAHLISGGVAHSTDTDSQSAQLLDAAWRLQTAGAPSQYSLDTDVDAQCLYRLEEDMFEISSDAGAASMYQWGLDSGHHQSNWNPYAGLPYTKEDGDCATEEDDKFQVITFCPIGKYHFLNSFNQQKGASFVEYVSPQEPAAADAPKPRPRPRPLPKCSP
ncbi:hypothetical protein BJ165DRAFT_1410375 [Panaeolus papilionaceus]|nr:hypothetical protein BJ165DRAFT_1410375 [Panaeolus papilionaceus]